MDEEQIVEQLARGGRSAELAVISLYKIYASKLLRFFVYHGASGDDARDLLQDVVIKVVMGAKSFSKPGAERAWIWQITRNHLTDYLRSKGRLGQHEVLYGAERWRRLEATIEDEPITLRKLEIHDCVTHGIMAFGDVMPDRAYVLTRLMDGATVLDIAEEIGRTPGATKEYLSQCRKKVAPFIADCLELLAD